MRQPRFWLICLALAGLMGCGVARADELAEVQRLHAAGQTDQALQRAEKYLAGKPKDAQMRFAVGVMLVETHRSAEAMTMFERLIEDYPELPEPYNNLATLKAAAGDYEGAKASLDQALRANPSLALAQENMGDVQVMLAMRSYGRVLQLEPNNNSVPAKLALLRQLIKVPAGAAP
jgi:tetratricopeptide (TPR) repeat protein